MDRSFRAALVAATVALVGVGVPSAAATAGTEEHCIVEVVGQRRSGELVVSDPVCFADEAAVARELGAPVSESSTDGETRQAIAALSGTIGVHYEGANFTGSSITVSGSNCLGGYVNLTTAWRNRISSTINGCSVVRFYNLVNLGGSAESTFASGNLGPLNNLADSIQYTT